MAIYHSGLTLRRTIVHVEKIFSASQLGVAISQLIGFSKQACMAHNSSITAVCGRMCYCHHSVEGFYLSIHCRYIVTVQIITSYNYCSLHDILNTCWKTLSHQHSCIGVGVRSVKNCWCPATCGAAIIDRDKIYFPSASPPEFFTRYFVLAFLSFAVVTNTNAAVKRPPLQPTMDVSITSEPKRQSTTDGEMKAFPGINIAMGMSDQPEYRLLVGGTDPAQWLHIS